MPQITQNNVFLASHTTLTIGRSAVFRAPISKVLLILPMRFLKGGIFEALSPPSLNYWELLRIGLSIATRQSKSADFIIPHLSIAFFVIVLFLSSGIWIHGAKSPDQAGYFAARVHRPGNYSDGEESGCGQRNCDVRECGQAASPGSVVTIVRFRVMFIGWPFV